MAEEDTPEKREARRILGKWARSKTPEEVKAFAEKTAESGARLYAALKSLQKPKRTKR